MGKLVVVVGGTRSGKSRFAAGLAERLAGRHVTYIATAAGAKDPEMAERIRRHRKNRPPSWKTVVAPTRLKSRLSRPKALKGLLLIDCLTFYLANQFMQKFHKCRTESVRRRLERDILVEVRELAHHLSLRKDPAILITNDVGSSVVPDNRMARSYSDAVGQANQIMAAAAQEVYYVVAGIAQKIK